MTMSFNYTSSCSAIYIATICQFYLTIQIPANIPTDLRLEMYSSDNSSFVVMVFSKPNITIGQNYNLTTSPIPQMNSSVGDARVKI